MPVLDARGIVKTLGAGRAERRILNGVDLAVDAGEVVAVLGRSGSGKSTWTGRTAAGSSWPAATSRSRARARWPRPGCVMSGSCSSPST
jgi:ABC-type dipeptide/oligopeptide/nickel transport system ATPase subunit